MLKILEQFAKRTQELFPWQRYLQITVLCIYSMAFIFKDISSFEVFCNIEAFYVKKGLLLRNKQSWEFLFDVLQWSEGLSYRNIYGKIFYTFCIEYATKLH